MAILRISLFSKMFHSQKTYHLVHPLTSSQKNNIQRSIHLKSASSDLAAQMMTTAKVNMFEKNCQFQPKNEKQYLYVGYKWIKNVRSRGEKRKKTINQFGKKTYDNLLQAARTSNKKAQMYQGVLTKQEVIKQFSPASTKQGILIHPSHTTSCKNNSNMLEIKMKSTRLDKSNLSIARLKERAQEYKQIWRNQTKMKHRGHCRINKENLSHNPSIIDSSDDYREISERKSQLERKEKLMNVKPDHWQALLRTTDSFEQLYTKGNYHIETEGFKANGTNKLLKELSWVNEKDREGFFFKSNFHDQILLPS